MSGALDYARELEAADARLAEQIEAVADLQRRAAAAGGSATELAAFAQALPVERERFARELEEAEAVVAALGAGLERAAAALGEQDDPEARRSLVRARDVLAVARRGLERLREERDALEARAAALPGETEALARAAAEVTEALAHPPVTAPPPEPAALVEWASRARAALLLARSALDAQREQVVREANELAASVLGEPVAASVTGVRERLERRP